MATYLVLCNWTEQGIRNVKESPKRLDAARQAAKGMGCEIGTIHMLTGRYDLAVFVEAPDDATLARLLLTIGQGGALRTTTMRAFPEAEYRKITAAIG